MKGQEVSKKILSRIIKDCNKVGRSLVKRKCCQCSLWDTVDGKYKEAKLMS